MTESKTWLIAASIMALCAAPAVSAPTTLPGLTNEYRFDDGSGNVVVDSVGGNNATLQNFAAPPNWINGFFGGALDFNNANQYAVTAAPIAATSGSQFSVSFWSLMTGAYNGNNAVILTPQSTNWISNNSSNGVGIGIDTVHDPSGPLAGVWENYTITVDRTTNKAQVYRDGVLRASGTDVLGTANLNWVFAHNQDPNNNSSSWQGGLDEVQFYNRVLSASDARAQLAARPPQPGIAAHLVAAAQNYGSQPTGTYATASSTFFVDVAHTDWIAWNRFPDLRATSLTNPGPLYVGAYRPEVDDSFNLTITNPLGQHITVAMDQNGPVGAPIGQQAMILGTAGVAPIVVRGDNLGSPSLLSESGAFNSIFTVSGNYTFSFSFQNIDGPAGYPDVYLLTHSVPEPSTLVLIVAGLAAAAVLRERKRYCGAAEPI